MGKITVKVLKKVVTTGGRTTTTVNPAYSAPRGWGGENYMTISNEGVRAAMDATAARLIYRDSEALSRINAAIMDLHNQVTAYRQNQEAQINRNIARGLPADEQIARYKLTLKQAAGNLAILKKKATKLRCTGYKCKSTELLYGP
jgi:hypothetical protein